MLSYGFEEGIDYQAVWFSHIMKMARRYDKEGLRSNN
jgi:hypothetical protein